MSFYPSIQRDDIAKGDASYRIPPLVEEALYTLHVLIMEPVGGLRFVKGVVNILCVQEVVTHFI